MNFWTNTTLDMITTHLGYDNDLESLEAFTRTCNRKVKSGKRTNLHDITRPRQNNVQNARFVLLANRVRALLVADNLHAHLY